jgi:ParB-like nuclease family protein
VQFEQSGERAGDRGRADEASRKVRAEDVGARRREVEAWSGDRSERDAADDDDHERPGREGLPKRFRMRHGRHYVDELLGDAPLRTVREIPISEIEPPEDEGCDFARLHRLESSIRALGVLEPLLVARRGLEYRVIAGMRRLRAARTVGLNTVPCLVHDVDDEKLDTMRDAAREGDAIAAGSFPIATRVEPVIDDETPPPSPVALDASAASVDDDRSFLSALLAAKGPGIDERLRLAVLTDLAGVELLRAKIASSAADALMRTAPLDRTPVSCAALIDDAVAAIAVEARLRGVNIEKEGPSPDVTMSLDGAACRIALSGLLQAMLTLTPSGPATLRVHTRITVVRPALIIDCEWRLDAAGPIVIPDDARDRFFDSEWLGHPCGQSGATLLAMLARTARAHGGRVQAGVSGVTFVLPRPLSEIG